MSEEKLDLILEELNEIAKWTKFQSLDKLHDILSKVLKSENEKIAYELSDGVRTTRDIAKEIGLNSKSTIIAYWQKWSKIGIVEESKKFKGRMKHFVSLEEVGIDIPKSKKNENTKNIKSNIEENN